MKQETIEYLCDCCSIDITDKDINKIKVEVQPYVYFLNGSSQSYISLDLCNDCMKKLKLLDSENIRGRFVQMLKRSC